MPPSATAVAASRPSPATMICGLRTEATQSFAQSELGCARESEHTTGGVTDCCAETEEHVDWRGETTCARRVPARVWSVWLRRVQHGPEGQHGRKEALVRLSEHGLTLLVGKEAVRTERNRLHWLALHEAAPFSGIARPSSEFAARSRRRTIQRAMLATSGRSAVTSRMMPRFLLCSQAVRRRSHHKYVSTTCQEVESNKVFT